MWQQITILVVDLKSDKLTARNKAFKELNDILTIRSRELQNLVKDQREDNEISREDRISWKTLFKAVHTGIKIHASKLKSDLHENDPKITSYKRVILRICDSPSDESEGIPYEVLFSAIFEVFDDGLLLMYFGHCYLEILQKSVLRPKNNLTAVSLETWKNILELLFNLLEKTNRHSISFLTIVTCARDVVELGCSFSQLAADIHKYLPSLTNLLEKRTDEREKLELLYLSYHCCNNIAIDYRFEVCRFTETIMKHIHAVFKVDINEQCKLILFKLMDLALIVHHPSLENDRHTLEYVHNKDVWNLQLRNFVYIAQLELKLPPKSKYQNQTRLQQVHPVLAQFAARLCFLTFWDDTVWQTVDHGEPSQAKRTKQADKLQSLMDFAEPSEDPKEFNWKWLTIIGEIIYNYSSALTSDDFQPLLQLLAKGQATIKHEFHIHAFTKCCFVLLQREPTLKINTIVANLCQDSWFKIADGAVRVCTSNNKHSIERHSLLQILIHYQKFPSSSFIEDVIKIFLTQWTIKCDATLETLVAIMKSFNMDSIPNGKDLAIKILNYVFEKKSIADLRKVITTSSYEKPSAKVLSRIGVICCLSKTDVVNYSKNDVLDEERLLTSNGKLEQQSKYKEEVAELIRNILLKSNERLLLEDNDFLDGLQDKVEATSSEFPVEIKCILDQAMYEELQRVTEFKDKNITDNNTIDEIKDYLLLLMENNEIMMNLADNFLSFEAFNEDKYKSSFVVKKIDLRLQEIERLFELILQKREGVDMKETHQLLHLVIRLFSSNYHRKICKKVRSVDLKSCIKWVAKQVMHNFITHDEDNKTMRIGYEEFLNAKMEEKIKFYAIEALCEYNNFEGVNTDLFLDRFERVELDHFDNVDIHTVFHVLQKFGLQQSVPQEAIYYIWRKIIDICGAHHLNQYVSSRLIATSHDIVHLSKGHHDMDSNIIALFTSFGKLCAGQNASTSPKYSPSITVQFILQFKYFHKNHFQWFIDEDPVIEMYNFISENFLKSGFFTIKMEAIKTLSFILHSDIERRQEFDQTNAARKCKSDIFKKIFASQKVLLDGNEMETDNVNDDAANYIATSLQLFSSLYCTNFMLRKPIIFEISKLVLGYKLTETLTKKCYDKINAFLKCDAESLMDSNNIVHLMSQWLNNGYVVNRFPWFFTASQDFRNFVEKYYELILLAILKNQIRSFDTFSTSLEMSPKNALVDLLPKCFAYLLPIEADCLGIKYEQKAEETKAKMDSLYSATEQSSILLNKMSDVIGHVLENVYDRARFTEICGFEMEMIQSIETIDCASFDKSLNHLKKKYPAMPPSQSILTFFCHQQNYCHFIEKLLMMQKAKIQSTSLKEHKMLYLLQYYLLVEKLFDYLNDTSVKSDNSIKGFIVREVTNFLTLLLPDEEFGIRLRETSANILSMFLEKILPKCAIEVKVFLNKIVLSLVTICKNPSRELALKCFSIVEFLVRTQEEALGDEIAKLDTFPDTSEFNELRQHQLTIKKNLLGEFSLKQEIKHFLMVKKRKVEGLIALRQQLAEKKNELQALFEELSSSLGFSEDGESSLLHQLIRSLIDYANTQHYGCEDRAMEAVKCLGEIGCYDLSTMVFVTEDHQSATVYHRIENLEKCQKMICRLALDQMESMLLNNNVKVFQKTSQACYAIFESASSKGYRASAYLRPYQTNTISSKNMFYETPKNHKTLDFVTLLKDEEYSTYKTWIKRLVASMLVIAGDKILEPVSSVQKSFAELLNPLMMQLLLCYNDEKINKSIIDGINFFFDESSEKLNFPTPNKGSIYLNKLAIRQMLTLAECIRMHCQEYPRSTMSKMVNLNYLNIAKSAKHCEAYFTAAMYCELWAEKRLKAESVNYATSISNKTLQEIMYDSFTAIGINDASDLFISPLTKRPLYLQLSFNPWQNILEHDAVMSDDKMEDYIKMLNNMGLSYLANKLATTSKDKSHQYECLWRLCDWDALIDNDSETREIADHRQEFEKFHYASLKCMKNDDELGLKIAVGKARKSILQQLQLESLECTQNLYKFLGMSQLLQQIEDFGALRFSRDSELREKLTTKWDLQNKFPNDFRLIEPILNQRNSIFDTANIRTGKRSWIPEALQSNMLHMVKEASNAGCVDDALKIIAKMRSLTNLTAYSKAEMLINEAQLTFKTNLNLAKHCLKRVIDEKEFEREYLMRSTAYRLYGEIIAKSHADDGKVAQDHFKKSISYLEKYAKHYKKPHLVIDVTNDSSQATQDSSQPTTHEDDDTVDTKIKESICVFDIFAKYFDQEYISRSEYIVSPEFRNKLNTLERNKKKVEEFKKAISLDKNNIDIKKSYVVLNRSIKIDEEEIRNAQKQKKQAAGHAMYYYLRGAVNDSSDNVVSIFRIISIWMANLDFEVLWKMLAATLLKIPSYKFIVALPQLVVRLNDKAGDKSNDLLKQLLERCCLDHPYHSLPLVLALVCSNADSPDPTAQPEPRVTGAKKFWRALERHSQASFPMMQQLEKASLALIDLANKDCSKIPSNHQLAMLRNLNFVQCPTIDVLLMKDCNYKNCVTSVIQWSREIVNVGGINAPKKIKCVCSDGITRPQLLKGKDDMRQDAVMQQVFGVVNQLLSANRETKKRRARVRTYKVVPLSRRSGILEWCNDTIPIGMYLVGNREIKGAHERYNPNDWKPSACLKEVEKCDTSKLEKKIDNFDNICSHIQPVFHQFFNENYKNPGQWFERRLAYTTSVAVSSMVGYILGIGDRHVQNILIDMKTAEVIHIDFGVAFEQGRILPHPELIPFRLTRDMVAPMGICGVDGVFRKTCEKTMEILRSNHKTFTTILEVLLYDPMYAWTVTSKRAQRAQLDDQDDSSSEATDETERDSMASRALLRVQAKLKGQADDSSGYSSVEGQVACLVQRAMNTTLLCQLFRGWQAYL